MGDKILISVCLIFGLLLNISTQTFASQVDTSSILADFGYTQTTFLSEHKNKRFYLTPSATPEWLNVVVLHSGLNDDEYLVDIDPLLTRDSRGRYVLSYLLVPHEINTFNTLLSTKLRNTNPNALKVRVFHHTSGKSPIKRYNLWTSQYMESPVFSQSYNWHAEKQEWRPDYEQKTQKNISGIGRFDQGTRYSFNSTKAYVEYLNKIEKERTPSLRFTETPIEELNKALKDGTEALRERHKKYALWSDGYWAFHEIPMAHSVINGDFELVKINRDFRYLFVNFLRAYGEKCQNFMKSAQELTYILSEREIDAHGFTVSEDTTKVSVILEADYVETYDAYWNNSGDRAAVIAAVFQSFSRQNKRLGYAPEIFRSMDYLNAARTMLHVDTCDEPAPQQLLINLLKRVNGEQGLESGLSLVANDKSVFTVTKVVPSVKTSPPESNTSKLSSTEQQKVISDGLQEIQIRYDKEMKSFGDAIKNAISEGASESELRPLVDDYQNKSKELQKRMQEEVQEFLQKHQ